jgi:hypothetical protein
MVRRYQEPRGLGTVSLIISEFELSPGELLFLRGRFALPSRIDPASSSRHVGASFR